MFWIAHHLGALSQKECSCLSCLDLVQENSNFSNLIRKVFFFQFTRTLFVGFHSTSTCEVHSKENMCLLKISGSTRSEYSGPRFKLKLQKLVWKLHKQKTSHHVVVYLLKLTHSLLTMETDSCLLMLLGCYNSFYFHLRISRARISFKQCHFISESLFPDVVFWRTPPPRTLTLIIKWLTSLWCSV